MKHIKTPIRKKRTYTIVGTTGSGKTVFLTALLHHLSEGRAYPNFIKEPLIGTDDSAFPAGKYWREIENGEWPEKTEETSSTTFSFYFSGKTGRMNRQNVLTLHDVPGERIADVLIYQNEKFKDWSKAFVTNLRKNGSENIVGPFLDVFDESDNVDEVKVAFKKMLGAYVRNDLFDEVSPSSFILDPSVEKDGSIADPKGKTEDEWVSYCINKRFVGSSAGREFFPVPESILHGDKLLRRELQESYGMYRKSVVLPVFLKIRDSHGLIILVDVLRCLSEGFHRKKSVFSVVESIVKIAGKESFKTAVLKWAHPKRFGTKVPVVDRIAYVASKEDLISPDAKDSLKALLESEVSVFRSKNRDVKIHEVFPCSAVPVAECKGNPKKIYFKQKIDGRVKDYSDQLPKIPSKWPEIDAWGVFNYRFDALPVLSSLARPKGLKEIFEFMMVEKNKFHGLLPLKKGAR